jgi:fluoride ion exporter CrcB/FEX
MERLFWICLAGAAGTGTRYLIALWAAQRFGSSFPYGTLIVNVTGCFLIALIMQAAVATSSVLQTDAGSGSLRPPNPS